MRQQPRLRASGRGTSARAAALRSRLKKIDDAVSVSAMALQSKTKGALQAEEALARKRQRLAEQEVVSRCPRRRVCFVVVRRRSPCGARRCSTHTRVSQLLPPALPTGRARQPDGRARHVPFAATAAAACRHPRSTVHGGPLAADSVQAFGAGGRTTGVGRKMHGHPVSAKHQNVRCPSFAEPRCHRERTAMRRCDVTLPLSLPPSLRCLRPWAGTGHPCSGQRRAELEASRPAHHAPDRQLVHRPRRRQHVASRRARRRAARLPPLEASAVTSPRHTASIHWHQPAGTTAAVT